MVDDSKKQFDKIISRFSTIDRVMPTKLVFSEKLVSGVKAKMEALKVEKFAMDVMQRSYEKTPKGALIGWDANGPIYKK